MTTEAFHRALTAQPFQPFTITMADGHTLEIRHPELIAHAPGARMAVVMLSDAEIHWIDLLLIPRISFETSPAPHS